MTRRKHGLGLLGLLVVAALAMAAFASSAQAVLPQFIFKDLLGKEILALHASLSAKQENIGSLLVAALNLELNCAKFTVPTGGGLILTTEDADIKLLYEECTALSISGLATKTELPCHVSDVAGLKPELLHVTANALALPIEFADKTFGILFEKIAAIINFLSGTGCPLPLKNEVKGEVCALIEPAGVNGNHTVEPLILLSEAIQKACPERTTLEGLVIGAGVKDKLLYGANEAFIDGAALVSLIGDHKGFTLGVLLD